MTCPLVHSMPGTRCRLGDLAAASPDRAVRIAARSSENHRMRSERSRSALEPLSIARSEHMIATAPHAADENHRFNAHSSSAVPFNWLFPHS